MKSVTFPIARHPAVTQQGGGVCEKISPGLLALGPFSFNVCDKVMQFPK